jgi:hypothetical protein
MRKDLFLLPWDNKTPEIKPSRRQLYYTPVLCIAAFLENQKEQEEDEHLNLLS